MSQAPTILLVDDEASIRKLCTRMLQRMGYRCLSAATGEEGLGLLETDGEGVHAVLLDLNLPDQPGERIASLINERAPGLPVIFFTGSAQGEKVQDADGNVRFYLKKPFTKDSIHATLRNAGVTEVPV